MIEDDAPNTPSGPEDLIWKGHTSQWVHFWYYLFCILLAAGIGVATAFTGGIAAVGFVVPFFMWVFRWWATKCLVYELTTQRLRIRSGIFSRHLDELELYRVKDYSMQQPFFLRLVGLGNITLVTSDATTPTVHIRAIGDVEGLREKLRASVQSERDRKRVRELDVGHGDDDAFG
tara:strand:+ start:546 stop:1070 length:525 start_codon:yes stop_codon:yes gene_type:complete